MTHHVRNLIRLSKWAGERFDLIQAGGGNSSIKINDRLMLIKASGYTLSELGPNKGFCQVDIRKVNEILSHPTLNGKGNKQVIDQLASELLSSSMTDSTLRPSIETYVHAILKKYTLHIHPVTVNALTVRKDWDIKLKKLFPNTLLIPYGTPGIELALLMHRETENYKRKHSSLPGLVFLQNHGMITSSDSLETLLKITDETLQLIENELQIDNAHYRNSNIITHFFSEHFDDNENISYLIQVPEVIQHLSQVSLKLIPLCPDDIVYWGQELISLPSLTRDPIDRYLQKYGSLPQLVKYQENYYIRAQNVKKCHEIEDVLRAHIMIMRLTNDSPINHLTNNEHHYLSNWEAEKYRKNL